MSYRDSHLEKGAVYDERIHGSPFDNYMAKMESEHLPCIVKSLYPNGVDRYMDFACGTGRITSTIAPLAKKSYGVDISASMAEQAKSKCPETEFKIGDFTQEPLNVEPVDLVSSFRFFGNAEDALRIEVMGVLNRVLRPGGHLLINNHRNPKSMPNRLHKMTGGEITEDLTYSHLDSLLTAAGFKIVETKCIGSWILRNSLMKESIFNSSVAGFFEKHLKFPGQKFLCPDLIVVAQKIAEA